MTSRFFLLSYHEHFGARKLGGDEVSVVLFNSRRHAAAPLNVTQLGSSATSSPAEDPDKR